MRPGDASSTSDFVALVRAVYSFLPQSALFYDPVAAHLLEPGLRERLGTDQEQGVVVARQLLLGLGSSLIVLSRARYTEEVLMSASAENVKQYVILGAGLDSFAYRPGSFAGPLRVFEIDHPATQALKYRRLRAAEIEPVYPVEYIPVDFTLQEAGDALRTSGFRPDEPAVVSWLGVLLYLRKEDVERTLVGLSELCAVGSRVTFDCIHSRLFDPGYLRDNPHVADLWKPFLAYTEEQGEPVINGYSPAELHALAEQVDWHVADITDACEYTSRYLPGPQDDSWPTSDSLLVTLEKR
jgi:methyltransferase (TIGR00027 family)